MYELLRQDLTELSDEELIDLEWEVSDKISDLERNVFDLETRLHDIFAEFDRRDQESDEEEDEND